MLRKSSWKAVLGWSGFFRLVWIPLAVLAVAISGSLFVESGQGSWYSGVTKPFWNPPSWLFAPVWTLLYLMIACSGWLALAKEGRRPQDLVLFIGQLILNLFWPLLFLVGTSRGGPWWRFSFSWE